MTEVIKEKKIRDLFNFSPLALHTEEVAAEAAAVPIPLIEPVLDKACLVGIEVEVENLPTYPVYNRMWKVTEDGSLRNDGREFISVPIKGTMIEYAVKRLFTDLKKYPYKFTKRCSIHVHMNARTMTASQVLGMMLVYLVMEKTLFRFIGENRENNIHCVPLRESNITWMFTQILNGKATSNSWMKYTAVNLVPLQGKGTIEFRHMHGTDDVKKILTWINLLLKIKLFCYKRTFESVRDEIMELNTNSDYLGFFSRVFEEYAPILVANSKEMEEGVSLVKLYVDSMEYKRSLTSHLLRSPKIPLPTGWLDQYAQEIDFPAPTQVAPTPKQTMTAKIIAQAQLIGGQGVAPLNEQTLVNAINQLNQGAN